MSGCVFWCTVYLFCFASHSLMNKVVHKNAKKCKNVTWTKTFKKFLHLCTCDSRDSELRASVGCNETDSTTAGIDDDEAFSAELDLTTNLTAASTAASAIVFSRLSSSMLSASFSSSDSSCYVQSATAINNLNNCDIKCKISVMMGWHWQEGITPATCPKVCSCKSKEKHRRNQTTMITCRTQPIKQRRKTECPHLMQVRFSWGFEPEDRHN